MWSGFRYFRLCERAIRSRVTPAEEDQVELSGETPKQLSAGRCWDRRHNDVNTIFTAAL